MASIGPNDPTPPYGTPEVPDEPITRPDLPTFPCPWCVDEKGKPTGLVLDVTEWGTHHKAVARPCTHCRGEKAVGKQEMSAFQAQKNGRPKKR